MTFEFELRMRNEITTSQGQKFDFNKGQTKNCTVRKQDFRSTKNVTRCHNTCMRKLRALTIYSLVFPCATSLRRRPLNPWLSRSTH